MLKEIKEFYPTNRETLEAMLNNVKLCKLKTILEPSAGKGDICDYLVGEAKDQYKYYSEVNKNMIDCIEIDPNFQSVLKGKGYRVVHDNFLTYDTAKHYDLIIMNPPFSEGAAHLRKAIDMQKPHGGAIICVLNAEAIKNPYSNERKVLLRDLTEAGAEITYLGSSFANAERKTDCEIALIRVFYPEPVYHSSIVDGLRKEKPKDYDYDCGETNALIPDDQIQMLVSQYQAEIEVGKRIIEEYLGMLPKFSRSFMESCGSIIEMKIGSENIDSYADINLYIKNVRIKYWSLLFKNRRITGKLTSGHLSQYMRKVSELSNYEFSMYNVLSMCEQLTTDIISGIESSIVSMFDELSYQYSYYDSGKNIHYYNGWTTNKSWIINKKVILPINAYSWYGTFSPYADKLDDLEKIMTFLDGGLSDGDSIRNVLAAAREEGQTKNIDTKYFTLTYYKKGTCHIIFKDEELLKKFNIYGSQKKGWLPPSYGKKKYSDMTREEKRVIDEFEGEVSYNKVFSNKNYYIVSASDMLCLDDESLSL